MNDPKLYTLMATWLLIFVRIIGYFVQAPIFGSHHVPKQVLAGFAALLAIVLYPIVPVPPEMFGIGAELHYTHYAALVPLIFSQFVVGLTIGYISFIIMAAVQFGAELLDVQMGLSVAASFDPGQGSVNMIRRMMFYIAMILYLLMNGHVKQLEALRYSFDVIPLTGVTITPRLIEMLAEKTGLIFTIGLQISAPVVAALFITQVGLGLLARVAPQMNVFMLSFPLNIMIGLSLLSASLLLFSERLGQLYDDQLYWMVRTIKLLAAGGAGHV
ncbi:MAG: flagellar biosynthetic protein FliR [Armatimonadetes bacterium]|nr:flagellar biosynthetic protein FliR [Armatimonadota bacterium]